MAEQSRRTPHPNPKAPENRETANSRVPAPNRANQGASLYRSNAPARRPRAHKPNTRDNASAYLSVAKAIDLGEAVEHAVVIGNPLNLFVTIHFEAARLQGDLRAQDAISTWLRLAGQWLRLRGIKNTFVWVMEHATGTGEHVHILIHCPPWHQSGINGFKVKAEGDWMVKAGMLPRCKATNGIKIQRVGPRGYHPTTHTGHDTYDRHVFGNLRYHLKAIDRDALPANDNGMVVITLPSGRILAIEPEHSNAIYGRRCSRSQNIGAKARKEYRGQLLAEPSKGLAGGEDGEAE